MAADSAGQIGLDLVINQQQFNKTVRWNTEPRKEKQERCLPVLLL